MRVLVVDDSKIDRLVINHAIHTRLQNIAEYRECSSPREAKAICEAGEKFDVAVIDVCFGLEDSDGYDLCDYLKKTQSSTFVIILTGTFDCINVSRSRSVGADALCIKERALEGFKEQLGLYAHAVA